MKFARNRKKTERFQDTFLEKPDEGHHARLVTLAVLGIIAAVTALAAAGFLDLFGKAGITGPGPDIVIIGTGYGDGQEEAPSVSAGDLQTDAS